MYSLNVYTLIIHDECLKKKYQKLIGHCCCVKGQFFQDALSDSNLDEMEIEILRNKLHKVTTESLSSYFRLWLFIHRAKLTLQAFR